MLRYNTLKFILIFFSQSVLFSYGFAQDKEFASRIISDLTSPAYKGRAYTHKGVNKAAKYIINTLKNSQVKDIQVQEFQMPVSVIKKAKLNFDTFKTHLGYDAIIYPTSMSVKGSYKIEKITSSNIAEVIKHDYSGEFILFDTSVSENSKYARDVYTLTRTNPLKAKGFIICKSKKLMQVQASKTYPWVTIEADIKFIDAQKINICISAKHIEKYKTSNIIALIRGESDSIIAFSAHYDHVGELDKAYFPGANDNASGVSMVLDIGRELANIKNKYTIALMFFTGEEVGLVGSTYFTENPLFPLSRIKYLFNLDVIGSGEEGITVVNGQEFTDLFKLMEKNNEEKQTGLSIQARGKSNNSDHAPFYEKGVKAVFIYARGKAGAYHNPEDILPNLSLGKYEEIVKLLISITKQ